MSSKEFLLLVQHDYWSNQLVVETLQQIDPIPEKAKRLMDHIIGAQHTWISRIKYETPVIEIWPVLMASSWGSMLKDNFEELMTIVSDENMLDRIITYKNSHGAEFENPVSEVLLHLSMHGQYHRGQIVAYARDLITTPPGTDMITFLRSRNA